jgi:N4-(beta-N-acetylglucosaminyl)-L-asparaginase
MTRRRDFIFKSILSIPIISSISAFANKNLINNQPIVVSTWDSGIAVNEEAWKILSKTNGKAIDAVEKAANSIENTINCCVGLGGNPDRDGSVTLDACIMDQHSNCGAVAYLQYIKNPISVARKIMELTPHVFLVGDGALKFALANGFKKENGKLSNDAAKAYKNWLKTSQYKPVINIEQTQNKKGHGPFAPNLLEDGTFNHDTMATIALDNSGNLSGACTTSGMGFKMKGRLGDSPIIGAGLFVDNEIGAATSSGQGEEVIRIAGSHLIVEMMRLGKSPEDACKIAIERLVKINPEKAKTFQVGFIAINKSGQFGAYSINPGFSYSVKSQNDPGTNYPSKSFYF